MDFLQKAMEAMSTSEEWGEESDGQWEMENSRQQAIALALLSLAADVRRVADVLVAVTSGGDSIAVRGDPAQ